MSGWKGSGFRSGDGAVIHLEEVRGGCLFYAARFRFVLTHSHLRQRLLGRNLITLFSTVNTPGEFFSGDGGGDRRERRRQTSVRMRRRASTRGDVERRFERKRIKQAVFFARASRRGRRASVARGQRGGANAFGEADREMKTEAAATPSSGVAQTGLRKNCARFRTAGGADEARPEQRSRRRRSDSGSVRMPRGRGCDRDRQRRGRRIEPRGPMPPIRPRATCGDGLRHRRRGHSVVVVLEQLGVVVGTE